MVTSPSLSPAPAPRRLNRVESIQWLRGMAAMLVVCNHTLLLALKYLGTPDDASNQLWWNLARAGAFGVDIFFVISGFVMALSAQRFHGALGAADFLAQRYNRIAPLFYLLSAVLFADILRAHVPFDVRELLNTLTFIPWADGRIYHWPLHYLGWSLAFEFTFYFIVAWLIWARPTRPLLRLALVLLALPVVGAAFDLPWMPLRMLTSPMMVEFAFGVLLYRAWLAGWFDRAQWRWHVVLALGLLLYAIPIVAELPVVHTIVTDFFDWEGAALRLLWWGFPALAIVGWTLTLPLGDDRWPRRTARAIGDASYSIYLSHLFVVRLVEEVIQRTSVPVIPAVASIVVISPIAGYVCYRLLEQPLLRRGQGYVARLRARYGRAARTATGTTGG